jgi:hypothetical protein
MATDETSTASKVSLLVGAILGFGGITIGIDLLITSPRWCSALYVGCMSQAYQFAAGGWLSGLCASAFSLRSKGDWWSASIVMFAWNAIGTLLCVALLLFVVFK